MPPKGNPVANYGLLVMMCQYRFISRNTRNRLGRDVDNGEAIHVWGQGVYRKSLGLPLSSSVNLKLLQENN